MTQPVLLDVAAGLRSQRDEIALALGGLVSGWGKYARQHAADPLEFARREFHTLVHYVASWLETGDEDFIHLYVGEKTKQFHDPTVPDRAARSAREAVLLDGERAIFRSAAGNSPAPVDAFFDQIDSILRGKEKVVVNVLFVGDCLFMDVLAFLTGPVLADGIRIERHFITSHDPLVQKSEIAKLVDERFDAIFVSAFTYAGLNDYGDVQRLRLCLDPRGVARRVASAGAASEDVLNTLADLFDCPIFAHAPAAIARHDNGLKDRARLLITAPARRYAARMLANRVRAVAASRNASGSRIRIVDEAQLIRGVGAMKAGEYLHRTQVQHPARFGAIVAHHYRDILYVVARMLKRKLVMCDLDNTLWEGVIGEGLGVRHHDDRQSVLLNLKQRGVVLAINSKNDPAKVVWDGARLDATHFVSSQINWDPKPINTRRIAQHLNLKEKDFVFVDDRTDERTMVSDQFPGLLALDALDPRSWRLMALWQDLLHASTDADRTDFYRQRDARQAFLAVEEVNSAEQRAGLYADLGLRLAIREASASDLARVAELINRTNQFNMTGERLSMRQVEAHHASPDSRILIADAADKFGTMGTIAVLVAERGVGGVEIPVFVLSCRVFGYDMETAILDAARRLARPGDRLSGRLIETPLNQPCRALYPACGFVAEGDLWQLKDAARHPLPIAGWLTIEETISPFAEALTA